MVLLGEQQANLTGRRLREMYSNYKHIVHSTLIRAVQTATFIHQNLPHLAMISDDFIREGGPVAPQPLITYWSLPDRVSSRYIFLENSHSVENISVNTCVPEIPQIPFAFQFDVWSTKL